MSSKPPPKIWVVDDEYSFAEFARVMLVSMGCEAVTCLTGDRTLETAVREKPDLILLDLHIGDIDGRDVLRELKAEPATAKIPVMLCTLSQSRDKISEAFDSGAAYYVSKPLRRDELKMKLEIYLGKF